MSLSPRRTAALVGVAALLVVGTDSATYAGTGDSLILGRMNSSSQPTTLTTNGDSPPLRLNSPDDVPSIRVSSDAKVKRLNADKVDGKNAGQLEPRLRVFTSNEMADDTAAEQIWELTVDEGLYRGYFSVVASGDGASQVQCVLGPDPYVAGARFTIPETVDASFVTGEGIVGSTGTLFLYCDAPDEWDPEQMAVTLAPVDVGRVTEVEHADTPKQGIDPGKLKKFWKDLPR